LTVSVLDMGLSDDLAEAIGQVAINTVIESGLVRAKDADGNEIETPLVWIWTANAAEQIGQTIRERFAITFKDASEATRD